MADIQSQSGERAGKQAEIETQRNLIAKELQNVQDQLSRELEKQSQAQRAITSEQNRYNEALSRTVNLRRQLTGEGAAIAGAEAVEGAVENAASNSIRQILSNPTIRQGLTGSIIQNLPGGAILGGLYDYSRRAGGGGGSNEGGGGGSGGGPGPDPNNPNGPGGGNPLPPGLGGLLGRAGGLAGLARYAGPVGIAAAVGGIGYRQGVNAIQLGRDYGSLTGDNGIAEAQGYQIQARMMAMSPFLNNEQARSIIQASLQQGYKGETGETVIDFVTHNFKEMNMEIGESLELYRSGVVDASGDTQTLTTQLQSLRDAAKDSNANLGVMNKMFLQGVQTLGGLGAGNNANIASGILSQQFSNVEALGGITLGGMFDSQYGRSKIAQQLGTDTRNLGATMHRLRRSGPQGAAALAGANEQAALSVVRALGLTTGMSEDDIWNTGNSGALLSDLQNFGVNVQTEQQAVTMAYHLLNPDAAGTSVSNVLAGQAEQAKNQQLYKGSGWNKNMGGAGAGQAMQMIRATAAEMFSTNAADGTRGQMRMNYYHEYGKRNMKNPMLERWFQGQTNFRDVIVQDENGNNVPIEDFLKDDTWNRMNSLAEGKVRVGEKGEGSNLAQGKEWMTVAEMVGNGGAATGDGKGQTLGLTPEAARLVQLLGSGSNSTYNATIEGQANYGTVNRNDKVGTGR